MMCGSTERPESLDTQVYRFKRGDRVRLTRSDRGIPEGATGTYADEPGDGIPYVDWDIFGNAIANEDALEAEPGAEEEPEAAKAPAFTVGQAVRITGSGGEEISHAIRVGAEGRVVEAPARVAHYGLLARVEGPRKEGEGEVTQFVSVNHLAAVVEVPAQPERYRVLPHEAAPWGDAEGRAGTGDPVTVKHIGEVLTHDPDGPTYGLYRDREGIRLIAATVSGGLVVPRDILEPVPAQPEPHPAALAHIPPRPTATGGVLPGFSPAKVEAAWAAVTGSELASAIREGASREATVEVFGEPSTEEVEVGQWHAFRPGDVIVETMAGGPAKVRREVLDVPEPAKPAPGTFGTAVVYGERVRGFVDEDGEFAYADPKTHAVEWADFSDFVPDSDAPALPSVERLAEVLRETDDERDHYTSFDEDAEAILRELRARG